MECYDREEVTFGLRTENKKKIKWGKNISENSKYRSSKVGEKNGIFGNIRKSMWFKKKRKSLQLNPNDLQIELKI